jgi:hypothetical protein
MTLLAEFKNEIELNLFEGIIANSKDPKFGSQNLLKQPTMLL